MTISIVVDTETTGLLLPSASPIEKQPKIIELCIIRVENGTETEKHDWLINPGEPISEEITKITGITNDMLIGKPSFCDLVPEIRAAFAGADNFIAHNAPFDAEIIRNELRRNGIEYFVWPENILCTVNEYKHEYGRRMKLTELYERKIGKPLLQTHRALDDVKALIEILDKDNFWNAL